MIEQSGVGQKEINIEYQNENGLTALALALKNKQEHVAQYLIARGANVNALNKVGNFLMSNKIQAKQSILFMVSSDNFLKGAEILLKSS